MVEKICWECGGKCVKGYVETKGLTLRGARFRFNVDGTSTNVVDAYVADPNGEHIGPDGDRQTVISNLYGAPCPHDMNRADIEDSHKDFSVLTKKTA